MMLKVCSLVSVLSLVQCQLTTLPPQRDIEPLFGGLQQNPQFNFQPQPAVPGVQTQTQRPQIQASNDFQAVPAVPPPVAHPSLRTSSQELSVFGQPDAGISGASRQNVLNRPQQTQRPETPRQSFQPQPQIGPQLPQQQSQFNPQQPQQFNPQQFAGQSAVPQFQQNKQQQQPASQFRQQQPQQQQFPQQPAPQFTQQQPQQPVPQFRQQQPQQPVPQFRQQQPQQPAPQFRQPQQPSQQTVQDLLASLSADDQQKFLQQFSFLNSEQQSYAYNQFLSQPPQVQQFAIKQFLSLDPEVLVVSIQQELDQERGVQPQAQPRPQIGPQQPIGPQPRPRPQQQPRQQQIGPQQQPRQLSAADTRALQQQEAALNDIIALQNSLNFPGQQS